VSVRWARRSGLAACGLLVAAALALAANETLRRPAAAPEGVSAVPVVPAPVMPVGMPVVPPAAARPPARAGPADAAGTAASEDELAVLRRGLVVPVAGIERSALRDSYTELRGDRIHEAMDVLAPRGTPVVSAADGTVLKLFDSVPGGLMVYASDSSGRFILLYGHLDRYASGLAEGAPLTRGQVIGYVGTTGNAAAGTPHLHFEIQRGNPEVAWWKGVPVNPYLLLAP
jgi:peptidoglycan LD-endopeptidase LytH